MRSCSAGFLTMTLQSFGRQARRRLHQLRGSARSLQRRWLAILQMQPNASAVDELLAELTIERPQANRQAKTFIGKTFVITGSVEHFANRSELKSYIEERGGKVTGSVTKKTDYLINNDTDICFFKKQEGAGAGDSGDFRGGVSGTGSKMMMIQGSKGQKAVHACMIRLLNLGPAKHEKVAICVVNQRISNVCRIAGVASQRSNS